MNSPTVYSVVDVQEVAVDNPAAAVKTFAVTKPDNRIECDVLIVGGGMGGIAAALRASTATSSTTSGGVHAADKIRVCLTEETDWLGGQMTAQGVSALDENHMVEVSGATLAYQTLRQQIREHYRTKYELSASVTDADRLNPGNCWVSWLSFEPKVMVAKIDDLLRPGVDSGVLSIFKRTKVIYATRKQDSNDSELIRAVGLVHLDTGKVTEFTARIILDATELGDLIALAGVPYRTGSESRTITGEPHAPEIGDADNVQDYTYPFAIEYREGEIHTIEKPNHYDEFAAAGKFSFNGYKMFSCAPTVGSDGSPGEFLPFWTYRRLIDRDTFVSSPFDRDISMINWDSNDMRGKNIIDKDPPKQSQYLSLAKTLSLGFLYWLQTEAPRDDGGNGYPELRLLTDIFGTTDGMSKYPYIREARRVVATRTIVEEDIVVATNPGARARLFDDSVGIGFYPVDIHGKQDVPGAAQSTRPFQIPLSSLIPEMRTNVLPCCKNIGTTHVTNGAYRLHPIEWAIGEAQGVLVRICLENDVEPHTVLNDPQYLRHLQLRLLAEGAPIFWFKDVPTNDRDFLPIQFLATVGLYPIDADSLNFQPDENITTSEAACAIFAVLKSLNAGSAGRELAQPEGANDAFDSCVESGLIDRTCKRDAVLTLQDLKRVAQHDVFSFLNSHADSGIDRVSSVEFKSGSHATDVPVKRRELARWLSSVVLKRLGFSQACSERITQHTS